jgi:phosphatidylserine/phosphatidylglycerophosphate/cardiolipin synthase-like enzyme
LRPELVNELDSEVRARLEQAYREILATVPQRARELTRNDRETDGAPDPMIAWTASDTVEAGRPDVARSVNAGVPGATVRQAVAGVRTAEPSSGLPAANLRPPRTAAAERRNAGTNVAAEVCDRATSQAEPAGATQARRVDDAQGVRGSGDVGGSSRVSPVSPGGVVPRDPHLVSAIPRDSTPLPETPYLDAIEAELRKVSPGLEGSVWERTYGNALDATPDDPASWILQVPDSWGWSPEDVGSQGMENRGIRAFLAKIRANIAKAERSVDITGFGVPNVIGSPAGQFPDGPFVEAIGDGLKAAVASAVAAGRRLKVRVLVGVVKADITVSPWAFRDRLKQIVGADSDAVDINVAAMTSREGTSYNHTKFVVVDGVFVIHGGINWMKNTYIENGPYGSRGFGGIAPVTDLDIALSGPAATSAGKFLDILWTWTIKNASTWRRLGVGAWLATNNDTLDEGIPNLYADLNSAPAGNLQVISVGSLGYGIQKDDPMSEYQPPPAESIDQAASSYWWWGWKSNNETNSDRDFMTTNPDANALRALIATATKKIVLSQQDINGLVGFPLNHALFDVRLLDVLAAKMTAEPPVKVQIVISNPSAVKDYSNIGDIKVAIMALFSRIRLRTASDADAQRVMDRNLQLAPLRVSDQPTWPAGHKYRLHTKVVSVDDKAFYIGSRNVYPDTTQDHGFIIEDATAAHQLSTTFLDKQWKYSRKAAIFDWEQTPDATDSVTTDARRDNATPAVDRWLADRIERANRRTGHLLGAWNAHTHTTRVPLDTHPAEPLPTRAPANPTEATSRALDLIHQYLIASPTIETGLDRILPIVLNQPDLLEPTVTLVERANPGQSHHSHLLRAIGHVLTGDTQTAETIIANTRAGMTPEQKVDWINRVLRQLPALTSPTQEALGSLLRQLLECTPVHSLKMRQAR